ncbi:MAG: addiction module protein [Luteolibacter sp.]
MKLLSEITKDCLELPSPQRLKLARILIDVSEPARDFSPEFESLWEEEIAARIEAVKSGSARSRLVSDVFKDLDAKYAS